MLSHRALLLLLLSGVHIAVYGVRHPAGVVNLDKYSFDKVVGSGLWHVLVKFDREFSSGKQEDQFYEFAQQIADRMDKTVLLAQVGVQDHAAMRNKDLAAKYGVDKDDFPAYKLFLKEDPSAPIPFAEEVSKDNLATFLRSHTGIYLGLPGCIEAFDKLAVQFVHANAEEKEQIYETAKTEAQAIAEQDSDSVSAGWYVKIMENILAKGQSYVSKERNRLQKLVLSRISQAKRRALQNKLNVLLGFVAASESPSQEL